MEVSDSALEAVFQTFVRLEQRWLGETPDASVYYDYDPLPLALFLPSVEQASALTSGRRFTDIGCGIGTKLSLMHSLGWQVAGLDRHLPYVEAARELVPEADIIHADLREVERFDADLVYMYRPGVSEELEVELERHVIERMRPANMLFLPARDLDAIDGLVKLSRWLWVKS